jgi:hypothetical protein
MAAGFVVFAPATNWTRGFNSGAYSLMMGVFASWGTGVIETQPTHGRDSNAQGPVFNATTNGTHVSFTCPQYCPAGLSGVAATWDSGSYDERLFNITCGSTAPGSIVYAVTNGSFVPSVHTLEAVRARVAPLLLPSRLAPRQEFNSPLSDVSSVGECTKYWVLADAIGDYAYVSENDGCPSILGSGEPLSLASSVRSHDQPSGWPGSVLILRSPTFRADNKQRRCLRLSEWKCWNECVHCTASLSIAVIRLVQRFRDRGVPVVHQLLLQQQRNNYSSNNGLRTHKLSWSAKHD